MQRHTVRFPGTKEKGPPGAPLAVSGLWTRPVWVGLVVAMALLAAPTARADPDPEVMDLIQHPNRFVKVLEEAQKRYEREVSHYSAQLWRRQNVSEKPEGLGKWEKIRFRLRENGGPWAVYLYWEKGEIEGLEALYVTGGYEDKVWIKHPWFRWLPPFSFEVDSDTLMEKSRQPITKAGIGRLMESLLEQCHLAQTHGDAESAFQCLGTGKVQGRTTVKIVRQLPEREDYYCHRAIVELDQEWGYPVKISTYNWDNILLETVIYWDVKWNDPEVTEKTFDKDQVFSVWKMLGP